MGLVVLYQEVDIIKGHPNEDNLSNNSAICELAVDECIGAEELGGRNSFVQQVCWKF
jgi:hypothetical protein